MNRNILASLAVFVGLAFAAPADVVVADCPTWDGSTSLQSALDASACVNIAPGSYTVTAETYIVGAKTIVGNGATIAFVPTPEFPVNTSKANAAMLYVRGGGSLVVSNLTLDGANTISYLIGPGNYQADRMTLRNGACSALAIGRTGVVLSNSSLTHNGWNCVPYSGIPEGAAIYGQGAGGWWSPKITGNTITGSNGPALDVNGVWGGTLTYNNISGNATWAAVSLYGASYWTVSNNNVSQPVSTDVQVYHPLCRPTMAPAGNRSAAIFLCQDVGTGGLLTNYNTITGNSASGGYGILLVGADETLLWMTPRLNTISGNNVIGSLVGCADDLKPGQWLDANAWSNNNCLGIPNTGPSRF